MTYPPSALAGKVMIAAGPERDALELIKAHPVLRIMLSPDMNNPIAPGADAGEQLKVILGHMTQDTPAPYIAISIASRLPEYCVSKDPNSDKGGLAAVRYMVEIYCCARDYQEVADMALMVLQLLECATTPHVSRWKQAGYDYDRAFLDDASDDMGHMVKLTMEAMLYQE